MIRIAIALQKGGVGKTTIAMNLARLLANCPNMKKKVVAIDQDPQGNLTSSFISDPSKLTSNIRGIYDEQNVYPQKIDKNLFLIGSDITLSPVSEKDFEVIFKLDEYLNELEGFDYAVIDSLPSLGYLLMAVLTTADYVLVPVKPAGYCLAALKDLFSTIAKVKRRLNPNLKILGLVLNLVDGRQPIIEREITKLLREHDEYGPLVFSSQLNKRVKFEESPSFQKDIVSYDPKGPAAQEFQALFDEIITRLNSHEKGGRKYEC